MPVTVQLKAQSWQKISAKTGLGFSTGDFATSVKAGSVLVARFCATFAGGRASCLSVLRPCWVIRPCVLREHSSVILRCVGWLVVVVVVMSTL